MSPNNFCFVQCFDWVEDENFTHQPPSQPHQLGFPRMQLRRMTKKLVRFFRPIGVRKNVIGGGNSPMKKIGKFQVPHDTLMIMLKKLRTDLRICEKNISKFFGYRHDERAQSIFKK